MISPLIRLDVQRLRNTVTRYWTNKKEMRRAAYYVVFVSLYLWWYIFRNVGARKEHFLEIWPWVRFAFPALLAYSAAMIGSFGRVNRWLARWSSGSWSVLPVEPREIAQSLLGTMFLMDGAWVLLGLVISIGLSYVAGLVWWQEFPFLLLATVLLVATASVAKVFSTQILRLGSARMLQWPNWILRALGSLLTMILVQPLVGIWLAAEYARSRDVLGLALFALLFIAAVVAILTFSARYLQVRKWSAIAASYEIQQTQRLAKETVPLANFLANRTGSPVARFVTLYNLRSGINMQRWGKPINVGGRRLYMLIAFFGMLLFLVTAPYLMSAHEKLPLIAVLFGGVWVGMAPVIAVPPMLPVYRVLRSLPVTFWGFIRAIVALPILLTALPLAALFTALAITQPQDAYRWFGLILGIVVGIASTRVFVLAAFPDAQQTAEFIFMAVLVAGGLAGYYLSWIAVAPVVILANIYFFRKATRQWRYREEGLNV